MSLLKRTSQRGITAANAQRAINRLEAELKLLIEYAPVDLWPGETMVAFETRAMADVGMCMRAIRKLYDLPDPKLAEGIRNESTEPKD